MNLYGSLIVYSIDTFSEHYCQTRTFLPPLILMATFPMKAFLNIENTDVILYMLFFIYHEL
jgi:hypothetical protein